MPKFFLQNQSAGYCGNSPILWKKGGSGYTPWIDEAEQFEEEEADSIIRATRSSISHNFKKLSVEHVESIAKRTIDAQDIKE